MTEPLSDEIVIEIRQIRSLGVSLASIVDHVQLNHRTYTGETLKLSLVTVSRICSPNGTYPHVGGARTSRAQAAKLRKERKQFQGAAA